MWLISASALRTKLSSSAAALTKKRCALLIVQETMPFFFLPYQEIAYPYAAGVDGGAGSCNISMTNLPEAADDWMMTNGTGVYMWLDEYNIWG